LLYNNEITHDKVIILYIYIPAGLGGADHRADKEVVALPTRQIRMTRRAHPWVNYICIYIYIYIYTYTYIYIYRMLLRDLQENERREREKGETDMRDGGRGR